MKLLGQTVLTDAGGRAAAMSRPVCPPDPVLLTLSPTSFTGNIGTSQQIVPTIHWHDGTSKANPSTGSIDWLPGNPSIASVSEAPANFQVQFGPQPGSTSIEAVMPYLCGYQFDHFTFSCVCSIPRPMSAFAAAQTQPTISVTPGGWKVTLSQLSDPAVQTTIQLMTATNPASSPTGRTFEWSTPSSRVALLAPTDQSSVVVQSVSASTARNDVPVQVRVRINGVWSDFAETYGTSVRPAALHVNSDIFTADGHVCMAGTTNGGDCMLSKYIGAVDYTSYRRERQYWVLDHLPGDVSTRRITSVMRAAESFSAVSGNCNLMSLQTGTTLGSYVPDCFYMCTGVCAGGGMCAATSTQTITVNGFLVFQKPIEWTCGGVTVPNP